ncbi:MAG: valine--tRNA ligase [Oscillospiraceae bacterium]|nr:valine--tRNA ligase [Oscillospiraceae bacterium]MCI9668362.1 valine--tRNA ligase [Oscillospiraceae bacterium]RKJ57524.1 valine--tRNA ligase [bacterium 1XD42-8]RKJ65631.1 valine--tRNA ligase [bacterium 1XD42-1]
MKKELEKVYDPARVEDKTYQFWEEGGYFHAEVEPDKTPYTIVIPPPNITGKLHMGHALDETLQDILIRWRRMQGYNALWVPGTDHASIATEAKIVEAMRQEGITKEEIGREKFLERAWKWKETYGGHIVGQLKKLGSSCDWDRERFTLDEGCSKAVREVFAKLYEKGLIYRGERIINWCPHCLTSISDIEIEYAEKDGFFWHLGYPIVGTDEVLEIATTRPETMLGDTAVAVHPDDKRYQHLIGKKVLLPLVNKEIPIVADSYVEMDFGTGVVKITPAHDPNDFEVGLRHNLPVINVFTEDAHINENGGKYQGLTREECRKAIVKDLEAGGYLIKTEPYKHNVGTCYRCSTTVEPRVSKQWFVKMEPLAKPAIEAVRSHKTKFVPDRFEKIYFHWMENIKDWCISRQLWWGHQIPAWYCQDCGEMVVARENPTECPKCHSKNLVQDPDTLDTWFSSALWPFSTLGWPDKTPELQHFYPTSTLVTGYDIIFFWVARMIFSGLEHMGEPPFETVLIHGLVRDAQGRKMSKSLGNGIDPLEIIRDYGADALRFTLATGNSPGNDMRFSTEKVNASRNFANKLWNAARFILMNLSDEIQTPDLPEKFTLEDKWMLTKYYSLVGEVTENLEKFELGLAVQKLYDFIWDVFCDWYIELCKTRLQTGGETALDAQRMLVYVMNGALRLLHPFMPFITEEIWQALPHEGESIMVAPWPQKKEGYPQEEAAFEKIMAVIKGIRNRRAEMNVPPSKKAGIFIATAYQDVFQQGTPFLTRLAYASHVEIGQEFDLKGAVQVVTDAARVFIPMDELIDKEKELARLAKEKAVCEKEIQGLTGKLSNQGFVSKAPAHVVEAERAKLEKQKERLTKIQESIAAFQ